MNEVRVPSLILASLLSLNSWAQMRDTISLSAGLSIPVGGYASKKQFAAQEYAANPGGMAELQYMRRMDNQVGLTAMLRGRINPLDRSAEIAPLAAGNPGYQWTEKSANWKTAAFLAGGYCRIRAGSRLVVLGSMLAGVAYNWSPRISITGEEHNSNPALENYWVVTASVAHAWSFSAMLKLCLSYSISTHFSLLAQVGFWYDEPKFKALTIQGAMTNGLSVPNFFTLSNSLNPPSAYYEARSAVQPMNDLDASVGVVFRW